MQSAVLLALEFPRIVEVLRSLAATPLGAERLAALRPSSDPRRIGQWLAATTEGVRFLEQAGGFALRASPELPQALASLAVEGRALEPFRLLAFAAFLDSMDETRTAIKRTGDGYPILRTLADTAAGFRSETAEIRRAIDPSGEVVDEASHDLKVVRERLRRQRNRLRGTLESFLRSKDTSKYLQDQVVTDRNGRFVLVVRAEHRSAIPGIVHGSSSSGASLFLEPLSTVEINNDIVALEHQEAEEVRRILLHLTDQFRRRALDLQRTIESATELDLIQAKARLSALVGGTEPGLSPDGALELLAARHPLLIPSVVARLDAGDRVVKAANESEGADPDQPPRRASAPVAVDIRLVSPVTSLIITGPNTGGKTVALKTAGLLALMAQSGLHVPAAGGSRVPVFRSVFADIGDEQSIAASLSTFSWHVSNIVRMDRALTLPALVLLDEVGAGTDPVEGGALGLAVVEHLRRRGAHIVATTHYEQLKTYASTTDGVASAAFGFDAETFAPSYQLLYGTPGRSLALEIAARLGMNPAVLDEARRNVTEREARLAEHLAKVDADLRELDHERRLVARERESLAAAEERAQQREHGLKDKEDRLRHRADEEIEARLRSARQDVDRIVDELRRQVERLSAEAARRAQHGAGLSTGDAGTARAAARAALDQVARRLDTETPPRPGSASGAQTGPGAAPKTGDRVLMKMLGLEGRVLAVQGGAAEVEVRGKRVHARFAELQVLDEAPQARVSVHLQVESREDAATELNVIGCSVDEAIGRVEKFLDGILLADARVIRIIHGHGTGQLRRAIGEHLRRHPMVAQHQAAAPEQGGSGVTVVELKD